MTAQSEGRGWLWACTNDVEDGGSAAPAALVDGIHVTVSVQNVDGQHR